MSEKNNFKKQSLPHFQISTGIPVDKEREDRGQRAKHYCITCRLNLKGAMIHP